MEKNFCGSVAAANFSLYFFVIFFSMTLIVNCVRSSKAVMAHYVLLAEHIEIDFLSFGKC